MFIRKKPNKSGIISVRIIDKSTGKYKVLKTIGSSSDLAEISLLLKKAKNELDNLTKQAQLPLYKTAELEFVDMLVNSIDSLSLVGPELLLGKIFDEIGFDSMAEELFRHLVITRLVYPVSKLKTVDYLFKYKGIEMSVYRIYRYLDKLHKHQIETVKAISLKHTLGLFNQHLSVVFYDVTTLYFEASDEDDLRKTGFSKDGKHQQPQIVLGLLVSAGGYPIDYEIFDGKKYEGDTLIPVIEHFLKKHKPEQLIVVADAGLLSSKNIQALKEKKFQFILGARIKNEPKAVIKKILALGLKDKQCESIKLETGEDNTQLIISFKDARAKKDAHNRRKGLEKLEKKLKTGKLTKTSINNKGYNKYLILEGELDVKIDYEKYKDDVKWDGLKGYKTNTELSKEEVIEQYGQLWEIEKTFRISKSDLKIRPIYHHLQKRIEAHICISFAACKVYKELERQKKRSKAN